VNLRLAKHYGIESVNHFGFKAVALKPEYNLGGLLTQGSVLIGNSTGTVPHPIYRAVWLREAILGDEVKPPPAEVPALTDTAGEEVEKAVTIKDLLKIHRKKESCNDCHVRLDPWGIPFEQYNAIGLFQPKVPAENVRVSGFNKKIHRDLLGYREYLKKINVIELDSQARVPHGPKVKGIADLKKYLLKYRKKDVAKNMVKRLLSYGLGRDLNYKDRYIVENLCEELSDKNYLMKDMILAVCKSDLFKGEHSL
jgi:hypothetical protein